MLAGLVGASMGLVPPRGYLGLPSSLQGHALIGGGDGLGDRGRRVERRAVVRLWKKVLKALGDRAVAGCPSVRLMTVIGLDWSARARRPES